MKVQDKAGRNVYYEVYGKGPVLILLNGIMMSTLSWAPFIEVFSKAHTLVLIDFIDQGQSDHVDFEYKHDIQVDAVIAVMEDLDIKKASIFGISYGGEIAIQVALKRPELIHKLLLFNTTAWTSPWLEDIGHGWNAASHDPLAYYSVTIPTIYSPQFYTEQYEWMKARKELLYEVFANPYFIEAMRRLTNSSINYDIRDRIHEINCRALVVSSEYDAITPKHEQEFLSRTLPHADSLMIPACGHASMYEKPELFVSLVLGYVDEPATGYII